MVSKAVPSGVVAKVTLATVVLAEEPLTRYAVARTVEARFGGENGILRTRMQGAYDQVPKLLRAGLIFKAGTVPTRPAGEPTALLAATRAGVEDWRAWLASPITMPDGMRGALLRLKAVRSGDYSTMLQIVDRFESMLQLMVQQADVPEEAGSVADRSRLLWSKRLLVAQLQWCQHTRDIIHEEMAGRGRR